MGNFSRDTFDRFKHYVNVRLQQGVPVVDSDWNEAQDIRKDEIETFLKWFVGDGVPAGNKGFEIVAVGNDDFSIADGYCLLGGWTAVNDWMEDPEHQNQPLRYRSQPLFTNAALAQRWGVDPLPDLTPPQASRTDTVYLDVWEREVNSEGAPEIVNPAIHIETCVRTRREWVVRVWTKTEALPEAQKDSKGREHLFYPLATIQSAGTGIGTITDLRRAVLTLTCAPLQIPFKYNDPGGGLRLYEGAGDYWDIRNISHGIGLDYLGTTKLVLQYAGNLGLGIISPSSILHLAGDSATRVMSLIIQDTLTAHPKTWRLGNDGQPGKFGLMDGDYKSYRWIVDSQGNVGIGTTNPGKRLHIQGVSSAPLFDDGTDRPGLAITGHYPELDLFSSADFNVNHGPTIRLGCYDDETKTSFKHWVIGTAGKYSHFLDFGFSDLSNPNPHAGIRNYQGTTMLTLGQDGNVGIGTLSPTVKLDVRGSSKQGAYRVDDGQEDLRVLSGGNDYLDGGIITIGGLWGPTGYIKTAARDGTAGDIIIGNRWRKDESWMEPGIVLAVGGNVGIGTTSPKAALDVAGRTFRLGTAVYTEEGGPTGRGIISSDGVNTELNPAEDLHGDVRVLDGNSAGGITFSNAGESFINSFQNLYSDIPVPSTLHLQSNGAPVALPSGDYAEYFESLSGKSIPAGTSVAIGDGMIRPAKKGETPIGVISANPGIVGAAYTQWPKRYLHDDFGRLILEEYKEEVTAPRKEKVTRERQKAERKNVREQATRYEVVLEDGKYLQKETTEKVTRELEEPVFEEVDLYDASGKTVIGKHRVPVMETYEEEIDVLDDDGRPVLVGTGEYETRKRPKLNPEYDESKEYVPREKRPEWNCVGLLGKLPLRKGQPVAPGWIKLKDLTDDVELWLVK